MNDLSLFLSRTQLVEVITWKNYTSNHTQKVIGLIVFCSFKNEKLYGTWNAKEQVGLGSESQVNSLHFMKVLLFLNKESEFSGPSPRSCMNQSESLCAVVQCQRAGYYGDILTCL